MNIITKRVNEIIKKNRLTSSKKIILENTVKFSKLFNIKIFDIRLDYLAVKIQKNNFIKTLETELLTVYSNDDLRSFEIQYLTNKKIIFNKFFILNTGYAFGLQKKIYSIYDFDKNKIGQIILKSESVNKKNTNVVCSIDLKGLFFKCYFDYLDSFFTLLDIRKTQLNILLRLDFMIDILGIEVFQLLEFLKDKFKITKNVNALTGTDVKNLENDLDIKYGKKETYKNFFSRHNDFKIYDKILDVLDNDKKLKVNGLNPYQEYLNSDLPITRLELKKKRFDNLDNNSINWVFQNIEALFFDYCLTKFDLDLSLYKGIDISLNGKSNFLAKEKKQKSLYHSYIMAQAYLKNIEVLLGKEAVYKFLYKIYPDLEKIGPLDLVNELDISDYFIGITDNINTTQNYENNN